MPLFGRKEKLNETIFNNVSVQTIKFYEDSRIAQEAHLISVSEGYVMKFVIGTSFSLAHTYLMNEASYFRGLKPSDLPPGIAQNEFHISLIRAVFFALVKRIGNDQQLASAIGSDSKELYKVLLVVTYPNEFDLDYLLENDELSILEKMSDRVGIDPTNGLANDYPDCKGMSFEGLLTMARIALCGNPLGLPNASETIKQAIKNGPTYHVLAVATIFNHMFQYHFNHSYSILKEDLKL